MATSKTLRLAAFSAFLAAQLSLPITFAQTTSTPRGDKPVRNEGQVNFCLMLDQLTARVNSLTASSSIKLSDTRNLRNKNLETRRDNRIDTLEKTRDKFDGNRNDHYAKLRERAVTDAQKAAVQAFIAAVDEAVAARHAAIDAAIKAFREGVDKAITDRQGQVDGYVATYKAAVQAALDKAKADCASGVAPATARQTFMSSIEAAKRTLRANRDALMKNNDVLKPLAEVRRAAVQRAVDDFKAALRKATDDLKAVMRPTATSTATST